MVGAVFVAEEFHSPPHRNGRREIKMCGGKLLDEVGY
jgi:hypothetical protein